MARKTIVCAPGGFLDDVFGSPSDQSRSDIERRTDDAKRVEGEKMTEEYEYITATVSTPVETIRSLTQKRENELLGGGRHPEEVVLDVLMKSSMEEEKKMMKTEAEAAKMIKTFYNIGINNTFDAVKYGFLDMVGVSSPEKRREAALQELECIVADLDTRIKTHFESVYLLGEGAKKLAADKRDIREIYRGYQAMDAQLVAKAGQLESDVAACYGKAKELQPSDPQYRALEQQGAEAKKEKDLVEQDIQRIGYKAERAASALLNTHHQICCIELQNQLLRSNLNKREEYKNRIDLMRGELAEGKYLEQPKGPSLIVESKIQIS